MSEFVQNLGMDPGDRITIAPGLQVSLDESGEEVFEGDNGLLAIGRAQAVGNFHVAVVNPGSMVYEPRTKSALYDAYWVPDSFHGDIEHELNRIVTNHKPYTPGTGGQGRAYVHPASVVLASKEAPWSLKRKALRVLRDWCIEELENRPLSHVPFVHHGDRYSRKTVNKGSPREWRHQKRAATGWNAFDTAHLFNAYAYTLAAYGDPLGTLFVALISRWCIASAYPGVCTNWMSQPRGEGWVYELAAWQDLLGLWNEQWSSDHFACGFSTEECARGWLEVGSRDHWKRAGLGDLHNSPKEAGEIARGVLGFQESIRLWGLGRLVKSGLPKDLRQKARGVAEDELEYLLDVAIDLETGGLSRVIGTWPFESRADAEKAANTVSEAASNDWEAYERTVERDGLPPAGWFIREKPRIPDAQMFWAAYAQFRGWDEHVERWWGNRDKARWNYDLAALARKGGS